MNKPSFSQLIIIASLLGGCSSGGSDTYINEEDLLPASIELQANRIKVMNGFNKLRDDLIEDSYQMLDKTELMLTRMNDSKDIYIDTLQTLTQPFAITTTEPITLNATADTTTPPFSVGAAGLSTDFLLLSSDSRFLIPKNTLKTRFKTDAELGDAWLRAVEFSNQQCIYVSLQAVDNNGNASSASNTLVVPLVATDQCGVQI